jgi:hypothetical protein
LTRVETRPDLWHRFDIGVRDDRRHRVSVDRKELAAMSSPWTPQADALLLAPIVFPATIKDRSAEIRRVFGIDINDSTARHRRLNLQRSIAGDPIKSDPAPVTDSVAAPIVPEGFRPRAIGKSTWQGFTKEGLKVDLEATRIAYEPITDKILTTERDAEIWEWARGAVEIGKEAASDKASDFLALLSQPTRAVAIATVADLHLGNRIRADVVGEWHGGYDSDKAEKRLIDYALEVCRVASWYDSQTIVLDVLGDFIQGYLREGDGSRTDGTPGDQFRRALALFPKFLEIVRAYSVAKRFVVVWKQGNHGRTGLKGVGQPQDNFEYMLALSISAIYANDPSVQVIVTPNPVSVLRIGDMNTAHAHGDHLGANTAKARMDYLTKIALMTQTAIPVGFVGHYHSISLSTLDTRMVFASGDFGGGDEYAAVQLAGLMSTPSQWIVAIDGARVIGTHVIQVGPKATPINPEVIG